MIPALPSTLSLSLSLSTRTAIAVVGSLSFIKHIIMQIYKYKNCTLLYIHMTYYVYCDNIYIYNIENHDICTSLDPKRL